MSGLRFADSSAIALWVRWSTAVHEIELARRLANPAQGHRFDGTGRHPEREAVKQERTFPHEPESVPAARRFATSVLRGVSADTLEAVELMVSELATNCIRHTDSGFELTISRGGGDIRVEATDGAGGRPRCARPSRPIPSGRGLKIIDMLSARTGAWTSQSRQRQDRVVHDGGHGAGAGPLARGGFHGPRRRASKSALRAPTAIVRRSTSFVEVAMSGG